MTALVRAAARNLSVRELAIYTLGRWGLPTGMMHLALPALKTGMWALVIKTAADAFVELDPWEILGPGVSAYERYLEAAHYNANEVMGQRGSDFYAIFSVARDASAEAIDRAHTRVVAEAPPDVFTPKAGGMSRADIVALVFGVLKDSTKRGQYDRVLQGIERRVANKMSWMMALQLGSRLARLVW